MKVVVDHFTILCGCGCGAPSRVFCVGQVEAELEPNEIRLFYRWRVLNWLLNLLPSKKPGPLLAMIQTIDGRRILVDHTPLLRKVSCMCTGPYTYWHWAGPTDLNFDSSAQHAGGNAR